MARTTVRTSIEPTFVQLTEELERGLPDLVEAHIQRMRDGLPEWMTNDPVALQRFRDHARESLALGLRGLRSERLPEVAPEMEAEGARELARMKVSPAVLMRGYRDGHRVLWDHWRAVVERRVEEPSDQRVLLERGSRFLFEYTDRVSALVTEEYERERERVLRSSDQRRAQVVVAMLDGAEVDSEALDWPLDHHHLGVVAWAEGGDHAARELADKVGRPLLLLDGGVDGTWFGWLSAASRLSAKDEREIARFRPDRGRLSLGLEAQGASGFRATHRQARRAGWVAWYRDEPVTRFADVALEALAIEDGESARAFVESELDGLDDDSVRANRLRQTLLAYFQSDHNAAAAAASLGVHQQTVANRIRAVEDQLGTTVADRRAELELALRLRRCFEKPPSLQAGLQNQGYLP